MVRAGKQTPFDSSIGHTHFKPWSWISSIAKFCRQKVQQAVWRTQTDGKSKVRHMKVGGDLGAQTSAYPQETLSSSLHWLAETGPSRSAVGCLSRHWLTRAKGNTGNAYVHTLCQIMFCRGFVLCLFHMFHRFSYICKSVWQQHQSLEASVILEWKRFSTSRNFPGAGLLTEWVKDNIKGGD